jgi:HMGL-like
MRGPNHIIFFDTTLRDGEQSPDCTMHHEEKLRLAHQIAALGVDVLEAGFAIASDGDFAAIRPRQTLRPSRSGRPSRKTRPPAQPQPARRSLRPLHRTRRPQEIPLRPGPAWPPAARQINPRRNCLDRQSMASHLKRRPRKISPAYWFRVETTREVLPNREDRGQ